ncbi:MAG: MOSC domain-containing protein [Phenylobacterium sp.]
MLNPSSSLARLFDAPVRPGRLVWIGLRPARREPVRVVDEAELKAGRGLVGDRYTRLDGGRQVTLIESEGLRAAAGYLGLASVPPEEVRRNLVTEGINLLALKGRRFRVGEAVLETSGECHPCSRMEETLGVGGYNALRGHGGLTARVIKGGVIRVGDTVARLDEPAADDVERAD